MFIKNLLRRLVEKWTGHSCSRCRYNCAGRCTHPSDGMYMKCWHSITRPGYTGRYERPGHWKEYKRREELLAQGRAAAEGIQTGMAAAEDPSELTEEELHQLTKIKATLAEAGETARDGGLLED